MSRLDNGLNSYGNVVSRDLLGERDRARIPISGGYSSRVYEKLTAEGDTRDHMPIISDHSA